MAESNLNFAKIVANPNAFSWSQAYNAGKLFAVLSLETTKELEEKDYLNVLGKEILDTLEQEFFTLEKKDLDSIKEAITITSKKITEDVTCSFVVTAFINEVLYVYILGDGKVSIKREGKLGNLIESFDQPTNSLKVASGFLQDKDIIILQTKQFAKIITHETLAEFLDNLSPSEASESLAPLVHEKEEAGASSIIIAYKKEEDTLTNKTGEEVLEDVVDKNIETEEKAQQQEESPFYKPKDFGNNNFFDKLKPFLSGFLGRIKFPNLTSLNHPRKVILTILIIIIVVFVGSVSFALQKQKDAKTQAVFNSVYPQASKKYEEGQGLLSLNQNLARDSFSKAKQILESGNGKLPKGSKEEKQVLDLLSKVNKALEGSSGIQTASSKQVEASVSPMLLVETKNQGVSFSYDDKSVYMLTSDSVYSFDNSGANKKQVIKNDDFWQNGISVSPYSGNLYVLDKKQNQIIKFVQTDSGFSNTNYFSNTSPDFSKAVSMAIDSSVYVLSNDGNIAKFTKGNTDSFSVTGLDKEFANPTKIFTNIDTDNIYVLDNGNSRIVVLDKNGAYKAQYQAGVIKNAKDFDVLEGDKKVYVLSSSKVFEIDIK